MDVLYDDTPCGHPLGGCYVIDWPRTAALGRLVTCHSLHCCEPDHVHKWVYWYKGTIRYLDSEMTLRQKQRARRHGQPAR